MGIQYSSSLRRKKQRWWIVDIPTAQQWLTTLKKEDQKDSQRHPWNPITSEKQSPLQI
jgi:hypothetical protein